MVIKQEYSDTNLIEDKNEEEVEEEVEVEPPRELTIEEKKIWIRSLPITEGCFESPIDLNLTKCIPIQLPKLVWTNFDVLPKKNKITNTGHTLIYSAKWEEERPYICEGPLTGKYVFSNFHLHWGANPLQGSEHTIDGGQYPAEMHVVFFKSSYLTQEAALKEQDGCVTMVYLFKMQDTDNPGFQVILNCIRDISEAGSSKRIENIYVFRLFRQFVDDYYMYWGSVKTENCIHYVLWLITRKPIGISHSQLYVLRYLYDSDGRLLSENFRPVQPLNDRTLLHVNPSSSLYSTILPISHDIYLQYYTTKMLYYKDFNIINKVFDEFLTGAKKITDHSETDEKSSSDDEDSSNM